jgi:hypothetical protein
LFISQNYDFFLAFFFERSMIFSPGVGWLVGSWLAGWLVGENVKSNFPAGMMTVWFYTHMVQAWPTKTNKTTHGPAHLIDRQSPSTRFSHPKKSRIHTWSLDLPHSAA